MNLRFLRAKNRPVGVRSVRLTHRRGSAMVTYRLRHETGETLNLVLKPREVSSLGDLMALTVGWSWACDDCVQRAADIGGYDSDSSDYHHCLSSVNECMPEPVASVTAMANEFLSTNGNPLQAELDAVAWGEFFQAEAATYEADAAYRVWTSEYWRGRSAYRIQNLKSSYAEAAKELHRIRVQHQNDLVKLYLTHWASEQDLSFESDEDMFTAWRATHDAGQLTSAT